MPRSVRSNIDSTAFGAALTGMSRNGLKLVQKGRGILRFAAVASIGFGIGWADTARGATDLTGTWTCNDSATYYLHQIDNTVWWYAQEFPSQANPGYTNVAKGTLSSSGDMKMAWADVPKGSNNGNGTLHLSLQSANQFLYVSQNHGGLWGLGCSTWTR